MATILASYKPKDKLLQTKRSDGDGLIAKQVSEY